MEDPIKNLRDLSDKYQSQLNEIRNKLSVLYSIPKAKSLDGKCFKYRDAYQYTGKRICWVYKRVIAVVGENLIVDTFQTNRFDRMEIRFNEIEYVSRFDNKSFIQISQKDYFKQFNDMLKMLSKRGFYGRK